MADMQGRLGNNLSEALENVFEPDDANIYLAADPNNPQAVAFAAYFNVRASAHRRGLPYPDLQAPPLDFASDAVEFRMWDETSPNRAAKLDHLNTAFHSVLDQSQEIEAAVTKTADAMADEMERNAATAPPTDHIIPADQEYVVHGIDHIDLVADKRSEGAVAYAEFMRKTMEDINNGKEPNMDGMPTNVPLSAIEFRATRGAAAADIRDVKEMNYLIHNMDDIVGDMAGSLEQNLSSAPKPGTRATSAPVIPG